MSNVNLLPQNAVKFRENSADSVVFHLQGSTPSMPKSLTVTRILPTARKGNAGTMKIMINVRITSNLGDQITPRYVPTILKLETSCPVGAGNGPLVEAFHAIKTIVDVSGEALADQDALFLTGLLLDNTGIQPQGQV